MDADLFSEGSIYFYHNQTNTKRDYKNDSLNHDFLVSRPVYIIKQKPAPYDDFTLNVLSITSSRNRVGIPINIDGLKNGKILPSRIYSVHREYLTRYMGKANDSIMKEVNDAVKYHLGITENKPSYMIDYEIQEKRIQEIVNHFTLKEKGIYDFIIANGIINDNYFIEVSELFAAYKKRSNDESYDRIQDFSKGVIKVVDAIPGIDQEIKNQIRTIHGMSLNGNIHKINTSCQKTERKKKLLSGASELLNDLEYDDMTKDELLQLLNEHDVKMYRRLSIIDKIEYFCKKDSPLEIDGLSKEAERIIKHLIKNDIHEKKTQVLRVIKKGCSPYNMSVINQYILYICTNDELSKNLNKKFLKKNGITKIRQNLRNNIKHQFAKI